ncbi:MAG TPA: hypothetical protein PKZ02_00535 [Candidatus Paceibacterota bacterium]|nr:hypothetical protein [Candidatus Paceibacterota bacterium]HRY76761.1 hypothetical protein [Candidatus Paceibacterota bacterium]
MRFKIPKNTEQLVWTNHSIDKMKQYQLSEQRIRRVLHTPKRKEEGIAPKTIAVMQSTGTLKHPTEIWVMIQEIKNERGRIKIRNQQGKNILSKKIRIISAWRYPGISPIRTVPDIPEEAWNALDGKDDIK